MNGSDVEALVLEYLGGHLSAEREQALIALLTQHGYTTEALEDLREIYTHLDDIPIPDAGAAMTERFYQMLEECKGAATAKPGRCVSLMAWLRDHCDHRFVARVACGLLLLCLGWSLGFWSAPNRRYDQRLDSVAAEVREVKGMVAYAMLNQSSPSERLRTIDQIKTCGTVNEGMIAMLLNMLQRDPNVNVRLVALETLAVQTDRPTVRQGLVQSLGQQDSPLVQLALADVLFSLDGATFLNPLRKLLESPDLNDTVRTRITDGLERLM